ncbi:hypothetical protein ACFLXG_03330 [Chloroflexota bacterium]
MGAEVIFECINCGQKFTKSFGGGWNFALLRCAKCDSTKSVDYKVNDEGKKILPNDIFCRKCGGEMGADILPMCPFCHSRSNETEEILTLYD